MIFESFFDALFDKFPIREPQLGFILPGGPDLLAPRLRLACNGRLFQSNLISRDSFAASAGAGMNAVPPKNTVATTMLTNKPLAV